MRRRRPEEDRTSSADTKRAGRPTPAGGILALQQSAGNHAVTSMLSRKEGEEKAGDEKKRSPFVADFGKDATQIPLLSISSGMSSQRRRGPMGDGENSDKGSHDVVCSATSGEFSADVLRWAAESRMFPKVVITGSSVVITLTEAMVTNFQTGSTGDKDPIDSWTLNAAKVEFGTAKAD